jgi:hypothetical protein
VDPREECALSTVAVIVLVVVVLLLAAMLTAALRRSAIRHAHHGPTADSPFRSHAEASRRDPRR